MDWVLFLKDIVVVAAVPIIYWLRVLINKQEQLNDRVSHISKALEEIEDSLLEAERERGEVADRFNGRLVGLKGSVRSVEGKVDMLLNNTMKRG